MAIAQLAALLEKTVTVGDVFLFAALLLPFWWMWLGNVSYGLRFGTDNLL